MGQVMKEQTPRREIRIDQMVFWALQCISLSLENDSRFKSRPADRSRHNPLPADFDTIVRKGKGVWYLLLSNASSTADV